MRGKTISFNQTSMILYKYYPCDRNTILSLSAKGLWCHYATKMNDPFECLWSMERTFTDDDLNKLKEFAKSTNQRTLRKISTWDNQTLTHYFNKVRREFIEKYAFCSLSENPYDILMWSHYADSHRGICVGFEFDEFGNEKVFQRVRYRDKLDDYDLITWAKGMDGDEFVPELLQDLTVKSLDWDKEKEWRIWRDKPSYYYYQPHEIKEINYGINCPEETKLMVERLVDLNDEIKLFEMETCHNPFKLIR